MTTITIDRATVEQALEALEKYRKMMFVEAGCRFGEGDAAITALRAALAQQAEPVQDRHGACPTHCCPVHGCKYMHDDCPVVSGAVQPVYPRNNGCESCADEAEPLNLADPAVRKRLASQWGYVPAAAQAEPVEPVDVGLLEYRGNSVAFIHQKMTAYRTGIDAAWDAFRANGLHPDGKTSLADMIAKHTAPPQRKPLTEEEIERIGMKHVTLREVIRAVERAHGIKE